MPEIQKKKLTQDQLKALVDSEISASVGFTDSDLGKQRAWAMERYLGEDLGTEMPDRSKVHTREVLETIEWILPTLIKIFTSNEKAVEFIPVGPEDEPKAMQETMYLNHVFYQENDGFLILYSWFKDALLSKNGIIKIYAEQEEESERESYYNLTDPEFQVLVADDDLELIEHSEEVQSIVLDDSGQKVDIRLHDAVFLKTEKKVKYCVDIVPPEEFSISKDARHVDPSKARFCSQTTNITVSELREMGFSDRDIRMMDFSPNTKDTSREAVARYNLADENDSVDIAWNISEQKVRMTECYLRADVNGDGVSELLRVLRSGDFIDSEEIDYHPFISITPVILTHKFYGLSVADIIGDLQVSRTHLFRAYFDNINQTINGTTYYDENRVNVDDMLTSAPFGIRAVDGTPGDAILHIPPSGLPPEAFTLNELIDKMLNDRVGDFKTPLDPDILATAQTGTVVSAINEARSKVEMIARIFAEVGVKKLFRNLHHLVRKYSNREQVIKLRGQWIPIDPREWRERNNLTVKVGLGTQSKNENIANINQLLQLQLELAKIGIPAVVPQNIYNASRELAEYMGYHSEKFFTPPEQIPPPQPPPDPTEKQVQAYYEVESQKNQVKQQEISLQYQTKMSDLQLKQREMEIKASMDVNEANLKRLTAEYESMMKMYDVKKKEDDLALKNKEIDLNAEYKRIEQAIRAQEVANKAMMEEYQAELKTSLELLKLEKQNDQTSRNIGELTAKLADIQSAIDKNQSGMDIQYDEMGRITKIGNKKIVRGADGKPLKIELGN